jgi:hypothetical protein
MSYMVGSKVPRRVSFMEEGVLSYMSELFMVFFNHFTRIVILLKFLILQVGQALLTLLKYLFSTRFVWVSCCY